MPPRCLRILRLQTIVLLSGAAFLAHARQTPGASAQPASTLVADGLDKGAVPLDGPWQFHPGENPAWAGPGLDFENGSEAIYGDGAIAITGKSRVTDLSMISHGIHKLLI